jgi:isopenicillin-N epimerase
MPPTNLRDLFLLKKRIHFLNHGSFGATPKIVFAEYQKWQKELEKQPVEFLGRRFTSLLVESRSVLASFLSTHAENLVFVPNTTTGINTIARFLNFSEEDEVVISNHEYGAVERTWRYLAQRYHFKLVIAPIPVPVSDPIEIVKAFFACVNRHTKAICISHITSSTAMIFPVDEICRKAKSLHLISIIDGAHAPGQISLDLSKIDADFYVGNLHKWLCAPKGSAFLYAAPRVQKMVEPLIVSWGWESENPGTSRFIDYLEWTGTLDISAYLSVPKAIEFHNSFIAGKNHNDCHLLCASTQKELSNLTGLEPFHPNSPDFFSQMVANPLPSTTDINALKFVLYDRYSIEIPIILWQGYKLIRASFQIYNDKDDAQALVDALKQCL